jgi:uncharacterized protein
MPRAEARRPSRRSARKPVVVEETFAFEVGPERGATSATVYRAPSPSSATLLLAPGAGAPRAHPFIVDMARRLALRGLDVVTFDFLYAAKGKKLPDPMPVLEATYRAAIACVRARGGLQGERLFLGGKSMGGRVASHVASVQEGLAFDGLVLIGYPLHPAKDPSKRRDAHLPDVLVPMLFVQGTRDPLGAAEEIAALLPRLPRAELHVVKDGDHSLAVPIRLGAEAASRALDAAADAVSRFIERSSNARGENLGTPGRNAP